MIGQPMDIRSYDAATDLDHVQRIWRECGWVDDDDDEKQISPFFQDATAHVALLHDTAECAVSIHDGTMEHTGTDLPLAAVTSVTTSRIGRRQGLAKATLATALAAASDRGAAISALGMFDQGFYDMVGFGTGSEVLIHRFDPARLRKNLPYRSPIRLGTGDHAAITAALLRRDRAHGAVTLPSPAMRQAELHWTEGGFGLGYRNRDGDVTHFIWCSAKGENGPYRVKSWAWQNANQLLELLGLLRSLSDQVRTVIVPEPAQLQLQPLHDYLGHGEVTRTTGDHRYGASATAWWQARVLDLPRVMGAIRTVAPVRCNLDVTDPMVELVGFDRVAGSWVLTMGPDGSTAERGAIEGLPTLRTSVNELTRLLIGVRPATVLAAAGTMEAPAGLLASLDTALRLPRPDVSMDF